LVFGAAALLFSITLLVLAASPAAGIGMAFLAKPIIDATYDISLIGGFKLTQMIGVSVPILILFHALLGQLRGTRSPATMPLKPIWLLYSFYVLFFSLLISANEGPLEAVETAFRHLSGLAGFYMVQRYFNNDRAIRALLTCLLLASLFPLATSGFQILTGFSWKEAQAEGLVRVIGMYHDAVTMRFYGMQTLFACFLFWAMRPRGSNLSPVALIAVCAIASVALITVVNSYSKSGFACLTLWILIWWGFRRKYMQLLIAVMLGMVVATYYAADIYENVIQLFHKEIGFYEGSIALDRTFSGRWNHWETAIETWLSFSLFQQMFGSGIVALGAHNDYLLMLFHGGIVGLCIYVMLLTMIGFTALRNVLSDPSPLNAGALMLFVMWVIDTIGVVPSAYPGYQWFVMGFIGLAFAQERLARTERLVKRQERRRQVLHARASQQAQLG